MQATVKSAIAGCDDRLRAIHNPDAEAPARPRDGGARRHARGVLGGLVPARAGDGRGLIAAEAARKAASTATKPNGDQS
jgi:hypothetical protein